MSFNKEKIQEMYPEAIMYEAQLINKGSDELLKRACESGEYFGQIKIDGFWYQYEKHSNNSYLFSRTSSKVTELQSEKGANVPHIMEALNNLPEHTILIGEIFYPGKTSKDTTTIMGCLPKKAIERQNEKYGKIHYYIHDIIMYSGINLVTAKTGSWDRYKILEKIFYKHNLDKYDFLHLAEVWTEDIYEKIGDVLKSGGEGMVVKKKSGIYEPGKRPTTNLKAKKVDFADVVIVGFEEPTVTYYGKELKDWQYWINPDDDSRYPVGSYYKNYIQEEECMMFYPVTKPYYMGWHNARVKIGAYNKEGTLIEIGTIHSGISDRMKQDMSENPDKYLYQVCEIQMMEMDCETKTIRHGFFKNMRTDKNKEECIIENIFS